MWFLAGVRIYVRVYVYVYARARVCVCVCVRACGVRVFVSDFQRLKPR